MSFLDILLTVVYFMLCLFIGKRIQNSNRKFPLYRKWFMKGLLFKLICAIAFCLVYTFYYDYGGDTRGYYKDAIKVTEAIPLGLETTLEVFLRQRENVTSEALDINLRLMYEAPMEYYTVNLGIPFLILGLGSYFAMSILIALFAYWGIWRFFQLFVSKFPNLEKQMAFAILFVPSVVFWGSGLNKDTFIISFLGLFLYSLDRLLGGKFKLKYVVLIVICSHIIFIIKAYVLISIVPAVLIWRTLYLRDKIRVWWLRASVLPVLAIFSVIGVVYTLNILGQYNKKYSVDSFVDTAQSMQGWHYVEGANTSEQYGRGSSYSLGEYEETTVGLLKIFPVAVNVTYFRPYLWEVKNIAMLAQAFESLLFLFFTLYTIWKVGIFKLYTFITDDAFLLMCVVFAIFFGFAVGFSSYNFGALSRYKIPAVPFYIAALFIIQYKYRLSKEIKLSKISHKRYNDMTPGFALRNSY